MNQPSTALDRLAQLAESRSNDRAFRVDRDLVMHALAEAAYLAHRLRTVEGELAARMVAA